MPPESPFGAVGKVVRGVLEGLIESAADFACNLSHEFPHAAHFRAILLGRAL